MTAGVVRRWFPPRPDRGREAARLARFYAERGDYHEMTASGDKTAHPQVRLLECLIRPGGRYVEVGCGSGAVSRLVGRTASVLGLDVSPLAVARAAAAAAGMTSVEFRCAPAEDLPAETDSADGCFAFEVLEHLWDPERAAAEMVRVARPGGFVLISAPNWFSLDLHIGKRPLVGAAERVCAGLRRAIDGLSPRSYANLRPQLDGPVFPDCDMVASLRPAAFARFLERRGCEVVFWDTTYMASHREGSTTSLDFQRNTARPFLRHFGDHLLVLARKRAPW